MPSVGTWKKLQATSGLIFGVFLTMHLFSHFALIVGWETAQTNLMQTWRPIYQHPIFEITLLLATALHMVSNTVIIMKRGKLEAKKKVNGELLGHRYSGYFLAFSIFGHVGATRLAPLFLLDDPSQYDYSFVAKANQLFPSSIFAVYLILFGMAGGWHLVYGTRSALATLSGTSVMGKPLPMALKFVANLSHLLVINAVLALMGYYYLVDTTTKAALHDQIFDKIGI